LTDYSVFWENEDKRNDRASRKNLMSARGVHFTVTQAQARALVAGKSDRRLMSLIDQKAAEAGRPVVFTVDC
jgi:hypothetical protein